jgi:hypothetical protein
MFPRAKKAKVSTAALGAALFDRKYGVSGEAEPHKAKMGQIIFAMRLTMMICLYLE